MENIYHTLQQQYQKQYQTWNRLFNAMGIFRLLVAIIFIVMLYKSITLQTMPYVWSMIACVVLFLILIKVQDYLLLKKNLLQLLASINEDEISFLKGDKIPFKTGEKYLTMNHAYAYDIDIFGTHSLYQYLNRTATYIGEKTLANRLLSILSHQDIVSHQKAIQELSQKINFRQRLKAIASLHQDKEDSYDKFLLWAKNPNQSISLIIRLLSLIMPIILSAFIVFYIVGDISFVWITSIFILNLIIISTQMKKIKAELVGGEKIYKIIKNYSRIFKVIEEEKFDTPVLKELQSQLMYKKSSANKKINTLSHLFLSLESINNAVGAMLFNGIGLYHLHILCSLAKWKHRYVKDIPQWLTIIGEMETLSSFANFAYNNPQYVFPNINQNYEIEFKQIAHPLIPHRKRVGNDVSFVDHRFILVTGSNMSGKTTFLRTLGVNIVLANIGAPVCALQANVHPLKVWVSMRQADSLYEGESYFFAEVKRLKTIVQALQNERCFVLLDEILKGTNSEDKHAGTIGIIKKIIATNAIGSIATHDLQICNMQKELPNILVNKCFEVNIDNDKLICDYQLKEGICTSKSATFLMKQMEII